MDNTRYILITPAYNEARFLPGVIEAVAAQTIRPVAWVIVSDASTDATDEIGRAAAAKHDFIHFLRFENERPDAPAFGRLSWRKVSAIRAGIATLGGLSSDYIANMDADVTFAPDFFERLMGKMVANPEVGIGGGFIYNSDEGREWPYFINPDGVGGPIQFFRRACFDETGGYVPCAMEDALALVMARMHGWQTRSFPDLRILHHKTPKAKGRNPLRGAFYSGQLERAIGFSPLYHLARNAPDVLRKPYVVGCMARTAGYVWATCKGTDGGVPSDIRAFMRREQMQKLRQKLISS
ncbi:glycosyltransferase family 2 protein [Rhodobacteraceae bacterium DSL-40]|uniref:glycosyltransferase family 2 protein n=1 Tax=Amaricoccus sp. B4 TaxID=3368557 RepID=UPI000DAC6B29